MFFLRSDKVGKKKTNLLSFSSFCEQALIYHFLGLMVFVKRHANVCIIDTLINITLTAFNR